MDKGILLGVSKELEWMLPWWKKHYAKYHSDPFAIVDLGLSDQAIQWVQQNGIYIPLTHDFLIKEKQQVSLQNRENWERAVSGDLWAIRKKWFLKPLAMLATPFENTIWMDVDCQIVKPIDALFDQIPKEGWKISITQESPVGQAFYEHYDIQNEPVFSSGIIGYHSPSSIIQEWADLCINKNERFFGDQNALSYLLNQKKSSYTLIDRSYNLNPFQEDCEDPFILHWGGGKGKEKIYQMIQKEGI